MEEEREEKSEKSTWRHNDSTLAMLDRVGMVLSERTLLPVLSYVGANFTM